MWPWRWTAGTCTVAPLRSLVTSYILQKIKRSVFFIRRGFFRSVYVKYIIAFAGFFVNARKNFVNIKFLRVFLAVLHSIFPVHRGSIV